MTTAATRKQRPYIFYGQTTSLCETCLDLVPTKIIIENTNVYYQKRCPDHGVQKTLISTDSAFFRLAKDYIKPGDIPQKFQSKTKWGCPLDCGLCPDHEQHSCLALIEITDNCNLTCPTCFADSSPQRQTMRSLAEIEKMMDALVKSEGHADVLQISGGEPTLHPQILEILHLAKTKNIRHLMLNTNGLRLAKEPDFVKELAKLMPGFELYLQFDSLEEAALKNLRGADLRRIRQEALENLEAANLSTTLVVTVKKGVNDHEIGAIIEHALSFNCIRGITFQPVQDAGRNENFDAKNNRILLSDIRTAILNQSNIFAPEDIIPLPCNPESIAIAYGLRSGKKVQPVTACLPREELIAALPNAVSFEKDTLLRDRILELFSLSSGDLNTADRMGELLCCLPKIPLPEQLGYNNIFRITIVQFMDKYNFCLGGVKRSCIHFITPNDGIIPFDTYNLFYRNGLHHKLRAKKDPYYKET